MHERFVQSRRVERLAECLIPLLPEAEAILDVGCGDGRLSSLIAQARPNARMLGIEVVPRPNTKIPVSTYDGVAIPFEDRSHDVVMMVDVLHHTEDPTAVLREAVRVSRGSIVIKDHTLEGWGAGPTLRFMDLVGNQQHGVALPYNYWPRARWGAVFEELELDVEVWRSKLDLYPWPASLLFDRSLHFLALLCVPGSQRIEHGR